MVRDEPDDLRPHVEAVDGVHVESVEQAQRGRHAGLFVIERPDATVDERGRRWFAQVVAHGAKHHGDERGRSRSAFIARALSITISVCDPDVPFRVPFRLLHAAHERPHLRQDPIDDAELERQGEPDRGRVRGKQQLFDLAPDALGGQIVERMRRQSAAVSSSSVNSNRAANWIARSTRRLSSPNVVRSTA